MALQGQCRSISLYSGARGVVALKFSEPGRFEEIYNFAATEVPSIWYWYVTMVTLETAAV